MSDIAIPEWARQRAQEFLDVNDPRDGTAHGRLAPWIVSALAGYMALHEDAPAHHRSEEVMSEKTPFANNCAVVDCPKGCWHSGKRSFVSMEIDYEPDPLPQGRSSDDWQPDERTVRLIVDQQRDLGRTIWAYELEKKYLPKPDPAKALVEEWEKTSDWPDMRVRIAVEEYTRWLIDTGRIKP